MNIVDLILILFIAFGVMQGYRRGFVAQAIWLIAIVVGMLTAFSASEIAARLMKRVGFGSNNSELFSFLVSFFAIVLGVYLLFNFFVQFLKWTRLNIINRLSGAVFGLIKNVFLLSIFCTLFGMFNRHYTLVKPQILSESKLYNPVNQLFSDYFPVIKAWIKKKQT